MRPHSACQPSTQEDKPGVVMLEGRHQDTQDRAQMGRHELYCLEMVTAVTDTSRLSHSHRRYRRAQPRWLQPVPSTAPSASFLGPFKSCGLATSGLTSLTHN